MRPSKRCLHALALCGLLRAAPLASGCLVVKKNEVGNLVGRGLADFDGGFVGWRGHTVCTRLDSTSAPMCAVMPKYHSLPFFV